MSTPYVYKLTHKITKQFYIGFRCANKLPPEQDIFIYQSSSKYVKEIGFENFDSEIVAVFLDKESAYDFEQRTIHENMSNPLILNKSVFIEGKRFVNHGHSDKTKHKMSQTRIGVKKSPEMVEKMRKTKTGKTKPSGRCAKTDRVAIVNIQKRIKNFTFTTLKELSEHIKSLADTGLSNVKISNHLNISQTIVAKYKVMFD